MFGIPENITFKETLEVYAVNDKGEFTTKLFETNNSPSDLQKKNCELGLCNFAGDIVMDEFLVDVAAWAMSRYNYMAIGTSSADPAVTTYHDLVAPYMSRVVMTKSLDTTYITNDTVVFVGTFTANVTTDLYEAGIFKDSTASSSDVMLCRQTFASKYTVAANASCGIIWKLICARS